MATWIVSGGGTALDDALNKRNGYSYANDDTILVKPGVYSQVNFAQYTQNISVIGEEGKENTIIDGQKLSSCLTNRYSNASYFFNFYGFTLRNGFISSDLSTGAVGGSSFRGGAINGAVNLYDCNIYDCSAVNLYSPWYTSYNMIGAVNSASYNNRIQNVEISGCFADMCQLGRLGVLYYCDFHDNVCTFPLRGDCYAIPTTFKKCKIHHNSISGIFLGNCFDSLIYENTGTSANNWMFERSRQINNTIANNVGFSIENGFGGASYWKNIVWYNNRRTNGQFAKATFFGNSGRTQVWNCYFDQLSTSLGWSGFNTLSGNKISNCHFVLNGDPGFVDPENDDFHLRPDSFLIGKGTWDVLSGKTPTEENPQYNGTSDNTWLSANGDFDGKPWKDPPSIGCYEYYSEKENIPNKTYPLATKTEKTYPSLSSYDSEVEYLECTGSQWINTKFYPSGTTHYFYIDFLSKTFTASPEMEIWGCWGNGANWNCWANKNESTLALISGTRGANNRVVMGKALTGTSKTPICLFAWVNLNHPSSGVQLYSYKVFKGSNTSGELVQDFVPVRKNGVGYLYDKVSKRLFSNNGVGNFILGPDKTS